ncbi:PAS domain S-box protein [Salinigranum sp. GCM10025319]|uniref:hybrid sensor histidine kinase/response regulator n=1 Tax=Salinigranum sp. GCM10025319 TaxID=3252687 RepID=UPI00362388CF
MIDEQSADSVRILHVDDAPEFADLVATFLERENDRFSVETATSVREGLDLLDAAEFDCVVSDHDMPERTGIEFLEAVRADSPDLPFVLFTGKGSEEVASDAVSAGVTDYLQKEHGTDQYAVLANRIENAVEHYRSRRLVERSERRLRKIVDSLPQFLYVVDEEGTYLLANEVLAEFHGAEVEDIEGSNVDDVLDDAAAEQFRSSLEGVLESDAAKRIPGVELPDATGEIHAFEPRLLPYDLTGTDKRAVLGITLDVTARKEREHELERAHERMRLALQHTDSVIFEIDLDTGAVIRHGTYERSFGLSPEEAPTWEDHLEHAVHPDDRAAFRRFHERLIDGERYRDEIEYRTNPDNGDVRWLRATVYVRRESSEGIRRAVGISRDVTEHKERELELRRAERQYRAIFDDPNILVGLLDTDGTVRDVNRTAMAYVDVDREAVLGEPFPATPWFDRSEDVREDIETWVERAAAGEYVEFELDLTRPDGEPYAVAGSFRPVTDDDGEVVSIVVSDREITDQKRHERDLEQANALLSTLFDALPVGVIAEDASRNVLAANQQLFDLFGLSGTADDLIGADCEHLAGEVSDQFADPDGFVERIDELVAGRDRVNGEELRLRDGRTFARSYDPIELPDGAGHLWVYRDVTDRTERERRLEAINETTQELIAAETCEEVAEIGTEAARRILGLEANSIHLYDADRSALVPVAVSDEVRDLLDEVPTFTGDDSIAWRVYQEGEALAVDDVHDDPDVHNPDSSVRAELFLPIDEYGIMLAGSPTPEAFEQSDVVLGEILASNVAAALEQVERTGEVRARERELTAQNDRLEEFASIVSHDLRNPLNVAQGRLELATDECESEHLADVTNALDRMEALIEDLLTLAREGDRVREAETVDLAELARTCWQYVETGEATLVADTDRTVRADRSRLQQLFENLFRNSVEHGSTSRQSDGGAHGDSASSQAVARSPGVTVRVGDTETGFYVEDDGPGIPPEERESALEAGYSTVPDGTGFGLSIVQQVADTHGWDVRITDAVGGGARIEVTGVDIET